MVASVPPPPEPCAEQVTVPVAEMFVTWSVPPQALPAYSVRNPVESNRPSALVIVGKVELLVKLFVPVQVLFVEKRNEIVSTERERGELKVRADSFALNVVQFAEVRMPFVEAEDVEI